MTGLPHCDDVGHVMDNNHCIATRHGEANAISNTRREDLRGAQALVIATPCINCVKDLAEEGIVEIDYVGTYANARGKEHLEKIVTAKNIAMREHEIEWADLFQELFDLLARKGGPFYRAGYRLKVVKEPLE